MKAELEDLSAFLAVARAKGFREAARSLGVGASSLSEAVRRVEDRLGVRLLHRSTRSVALTEAGARLMTRLTPALEEVEAALEATGHHGDKPAGTLRLNVPTSAARLVLPAILPGFMATYPDVRIEVVADDSFVDALASGCDAGIRYDDRLEQDMIAVPIGPRTQRYATAASPAYLDRKGRPAHPRDLLVHACIFGRFPSGALTKPWEFEQAGEIVRVEPQGPLVVRVGGATDLAVEMAVAGIGIIQLFEGWLRPQLETGSLEPVLEDWWQPFSGPFLYYSGRRLVPPPLRAFLDFIKSGTQAVRSV